MIPEGNVTVLTGATGFLGSMVLERLLARGEPILALVRAADDSAARVRLENLAEETWGDRNTTKGVEALAADVEAERLGLDESAFDELASRAATIIHCAASVRFDLPLDEAHAINVTGTERMVELAERARELGAGGRFIHVSTAYVHGRATGLAGEDGPTGTPEFRNTYEETKHRAERIVERLGDAAIVRPSIVVGDSRTGWTSSFNVIYAPLRALIADSFRVVPVRPDGILDVVPVDRVVDVICALYDDPGAGGVVQAVSGEMAPTMERFAHLAYAHVDKPAREFVPDKSGQLGAYAPYADMTAFFEYRRAADMGIPRTPVEELVPLLIDYAELAGWGRRPVTRPSPIPTSTRA